MARALFRQLTWRTATLIACENALIVLAVVLAASLRLGTGSTTLGLIDEPGGEGGPDRRHSAGVPVLLRPLRPPDAARPARARRRPAAGAGRRLADPRGPLLLVPDLIIGRGVFLVAAAFIVTLIVGWRLAFEWLSLRVGPSERLLLVGTGAAAVDLARELYDAAPGTGRRDRRVRRPGPGAGRGLRRQPRGRRHHRRHPPNRPRPQGRPRRREPGRRARQAADGQAARHEAATA